MGNTIISSLLFQPPTPANELDYFGNIVYPSSETGAARSAHNDCSNETVHKSKSHFVRGGGSAKASRQQQPSAAPSQQQVVVSTPPNEPSLHYIWLVSTSHPTPIPALHITWANSSSSSNLRSANTPSNNRYTLLYSHGNAEDIGLLAKFLTDISKLLQCDILVYDYSGYGVSVDRRAVLRFYAVWGGKLDEWRRWRRENKSVTGASGGGEDSGRRSMMREGVEMNEEHGSGGVNGKMNRSANGVCYSMDVFMAPMVFAKGTSNAAVSGDTAGSTGKKETNALSSSPSSATSTSTWLNLPDSVYVGGDELDFIDEDATTATMATTSDDPRTSSGRSSSRRQSSTSATNTRENSLLDMEDDYDCDYDDDTDMPSVTVTCYDNSTCNGDEYDYDEFEDEVSLFTCGASCNEVEHSSIVGARFEDQEEDDDVDVMMRDDVDSTDFGGVSTKLSSSIHNRRHPQSPSSPRSVISGASTTATTMSSSSRSHRNRRRRPNRQNSNRAPLTPKQKRRALLRKHKWTMPSPSEEQCYGDILLAYNYLLQIREVPAKHVLLYGKSVGSGPTCWLAQRCCLGNSVGAAHDGSSVGGGIGGEMMYEDVRDDGDVDYRDGRVGGGGASGGAGGGNNKSNSSSSCDDRTPGGVILHSPFLSVIRVVLDMGFTTVGDLFPNIDRVKDFT